jgi:4-amino-4-deoxy-L-arabinose transferase-like glycosyltransferase
MIGAGLLYDLGRKMETPIASLFGVCYYLFLPFSIRASRSFQPDPAMVMFILFTAWVLFQWSQKQTWKWTSIAGLAGGVTGFLKPVGLFFIGGMTLSIVLHSVFKVDHDHNHAKDNTQISKPCVLRNPQIWIMASLMISPLLAYYLFNIGDTAQDYFLNWTVISRWREVLSPSFFLRWMIQVDNLFNLAVVLAGFLGTLAASGKNQALLWGLWAGYFLFGLVFPYHILTHDYYHLPLVGLVALSLVPFIQTIYRRVIDRGISLQFILIAILLVFSFYHGWISRSILLGNDYRQHPQFWREVGSAIPSDSKIVGITQDYGFRLMYYGWRKIEVWPGGANLNDFGEITQGADYFLVTAKNQLESELAEYLDTYFPIRQEGVGFVLYDLRGGN